MFYFFLNSRNGVGIEVFTGNKDEDDFTVMQCKAVLNGAFSDTGAKNSMARSPQIFREQMV